MASNASPKLTLKFVSERETKSTWRFQEQHANSEPIVGTLYVKKAALAKLGNPGFLTVTMEGS
jgi:hypothetical protein